MLTLALEHSTAHGSAALLEDERVLAADTWHDNTPGERQLLRIVNRILTQTEHGLSDVDLFAVGLGPGAYTNLRTSLAAAQGFAAPGRQLVRGIGSAQALAWDVALAHRRAHITVVGNARRGRWWMMQFDMEPAHGSRLRSAMALIDPAELPRHLLQGELVTTPDWSIIGATLLELKPHPGTVLEQESIPRAETVGLLARRDKPTAPDFAAPPLSPIYIYPPVFVKPSFEPCKPSRQRV